MTCWQQIGHSTMPRDTRRISPDYDWQIAIQEDVWTEARFADRDALLLQRVLGRYVTRLYYLPALPDVLPS